MTEKQIKTMLADNLEKTLVQRFETRTRGDRQANRRYEQLVESMTVLRRESLASTRPRKRREHD